MQEEIESTSNIFDYLPSLTVWQITIAGLMIAFVVALWRIFLNRSILDIVQSSWKHIQVLRNNRNRSSVAVHRKNNVPRHDDLIGRDGFVNSTKKNLLKSKLPILIKGGAGVGKTAICNIIGKMVFDENEGRFDFVFYCTAKAKPLTLEIFCNKVAQFFGELSISSIDDIDEKRDAVFNLLFSKRLVLLVDNFEAIHDQDLVSFIFSLPSDIPVLLTSRSLIPDQSCQVREIHPLTKSDALELFRRELQRVGLPTEDMTDRSESLDLLMGAIDGNPLAIKWVVGRLSLGHSINSVYKRISSAEGEMFEIMFLDTWINLNERSRLALLMCSILEADVNTKIISMALRGSSTDTENDAATLVQVGLADIIRGVEIGGERFTLHPLARSFALAKYEELGSDKAILLRSLGVAIQEYFQERRLLQKGRIYYDALEYEIQNVMAWFAASSEHKELWDLCANVTVATNVVMWTKGYWEERKTMCLSAANQAVQTNNKILSGHLLSFVGIVYLWQGKVQEAEKFAEKTKVAVSKGTALDNALALRLEGLVFFKAGLVEKALRNMMIVLEAFSDAKTSEQESIRIFADWPCAGEQGWRTGEVALTQEIGLMYVQSGNFKEAKDWCQKSFQLAESIGDIEGASIALGNYGRAFQLIGEHRNAIQVFEDGLERAKLAGRKSTEGRCNLGLAQSVSKNGRIRVASKHAEVAFEIFQKLGMDEEALESKTFIKKHSLFRRRPGL
jgi:tetratricopeptide (TPR) repeat protein